MEDIEVGGTVVKEGQVAFTMLAAADRDPAVFPDPERLDITRQDNKHIAFGFGIHFCLGAPLARAEAQAAFAAMMRRLPDLRLEVEEPEWGGTFILRGLKALPVSW